MNAWWMEQVRQYVLPACCRLYVFQDEDVLLCSNVPQLGHSARPLGSVETDARGLAIRLCPDAGRSRPESVL